MKSEWAFKQLTTPLESSEVNDILTSSPTFAFNVLDESSGLLQQVSGDIADTMKEVVVPVKTPLMDVVLTKVHTLIDFFF